MSQKLSPFENTADIMDSLSAEKADDKLYVCKFARDFKDFRKNSVDLDEVAHDEPPHQDLPCLQM